jgi:peptidoglycan/xylan/chitin deacetylase (PgdA/CDA1 family)
MNGRGKNETPAPALMPARQILARWLSRPLIGLSALVHLLVLIGLLLYPERWLLALLIIIANHAVLVGLSLWPRSTWMDANTTRLPPAAASAGRIALTIDDGPDPIVTPKVLEILEQFGGKATFFCVGVQVSEYPELAREILQRGHSIENHTQHHRWYFSLLGVGGLSREIAAAQHTIGQVTGTTPRFFRAPAGLRNPLLEWVLIRQRLRLLSWTRRGFDTLRTEPAQILERLLSNLRAGDILLLHDGHAAHCVDGTPVILKVLPALLSKIAECGLSVVTLQTAFD